MDVDFAFICDYAEVGPKINALGIGFDTIYAPTVPAVHRHLAVVAQLRAQVTEAGQHALSIRLIDSDGSDVLPPINGDFEIPRPVAGTESIGRVAVDLDGLNFPRYGMYSIRLVVDGRETVRLPFSVVSPPTTQ